MGRPTVYTIEKADEICERLADGESLIGICRSEHMPSEAAVRLWVIDDREGFAAKYMRARQSQALRWAEEIIEIADTTQEGVRWEIGADGVTKEIREDMLGHRKMRVDTRKWALSKVLPKIYGDKIETTIQPGDQWFMRGPREIEQAVDWEQRAQLAITPPAGSAD